jgi:guanosine-3',5'-bis(diphosphate) 3'-pyrophosphohydrolase
VLAQVAAVIAELDANIDTVNIEERDGLNSAIDFIVEVRDRVHLAAILRRLRALEPVIRINRMKG